MIETKEHTELPWPPDVTATFTEPDGSFSLAVPWAPDQQTARAALADEWRALNPQTPEEIARFYQTAQGIGADLDAWHASPDRQEATRMLVHVAKESGAQYIVDIGCGAGHDLLALAEALPVAWLGGIEPNAGLRAQLRAHNIPCLPSVEQAGAPLAQADLLICIDVLEHIPDPETFLAGIAQRARVGCLLFETTATFDTGTPLHLPANRGWHPGRVLEKHGWELVDRAGEGARVRVWRREAETGRQRASLLLCAYRSLTPATMEAVLHLIAGNVGWRLRTKVGDAMISRSRGILVSAWFRECADDVMLFLDDDIVFSQQDADRLIELCRNGYDIIGGAYPVHNGAHFACRMLPGVTDVTFGPDQPPIEVQYLATGFLAVHRRVIDALVATMNLCHANETWSYWPLFPQLTVENESVGGYEILSEDWGFIELARRAGFKAWLDPQTILQHASMVPVSVKNMEAVHAAVQQA